MKFTRIITKFIRYLYFLLRYRSHSIAFAFAHNNLPLDTTSFLHRRGDTLHFDGNKKNTFPVNLVRKFNHLQLNYLVGLLNHKDVSLSKTENDRLLFSVNGIQYPVQSQANLSVVNELFHDHYYNISTAGPCVLLDIGMNVGYASLYFSAFPNVKRIYAYEPFTDTFEIARQNIALNDLSAQKVNPYNYGISNYTGTIDVPMLEGGSVIASTESSFIQNHNINSSKTIQVKVRDILEVLVEIKNENPGMKFALKIDCEGEEYNILEAMHSNKGFENVVFFCIEWHFKGPARIKELLLLNGFTVFDIPKSLEGEFGMIYGFRSN